MSGVRCRFAYGPADAAATHCLLLQKNPNWFWYWPSVLWHCWLGVRKSIRPVKNWVLGYWRGYLSGVFCKWFAYGPANATATIISCFSKIHNALPFWCRLTQVDQRGLVNRLCNKTDHSRLRKVIKDGWWSGEMWVGECFFLVLAHLGSYGQRAIKWLLLFCVLCNTYTHNHFMALGIYVLCDFVKKSTNFRPILVLF